MSIINTAKISNNTNKNVNNGKIMIFAISEKTGKTPKFCAIMGYVAMFAESVVEMIGESTFPVFLNARLNER